MLLAMNSLMQLACYDSSFVTVITFVFMLVKCCDCKATHTSEKGRNFSKGSTNTNESQEMVMPTITLLKAIYTRIIESTGTLRHALRIPQTTKDSLNFIRLLRVVF